MTKFVIDYQTFLSGTRSLGSTLQWADLVLCIPRGGLTFAHVLSLEIGCDCKMLDLSEGDAYLVDRLTHLSGTYRNIVIADDSIGTGNTYNRVMELLNAAQVGATYAVFYMDAAAEVGPYVVSVITTRQWVVMPWEHEEKIVVGDQNSLFRNGNDPYQKVKV